MGGAVWSVLVAVSLLAILGIRSPLKMLPLLFFELLWKTIWVVTIGLPLWRSNQLDASTAETLRACLMGVILVPIVTPWRYVYETYVKGAGDRWKGARSRAS